MLTYDGTADVTIREHYLVATFGSSYFYVESTGCLCIPVSLRCTDTVGDVWQYFRLFDKYNHTLIRIDHLCLHEPYNAIISIPRSELSDEWLLKVIEIDARCYVCDAEYLGTIELAISELEELTGSENTDRAMSAYRSLEFSEFWKIWCTKRYDGNIDITQLLFERIEQMDSVYFPLCDPHYPDYVFLWHGNDFCARYEHLESIWCGNGCRPGHRYLNATYRPGSLCYCISKQTILDEGEGFIDNEDQLAASILREPMTQMSECFPPENCGVYLDITHDISSTRHSVHRVSWDDKGVNYTPYLEVGVQGSDEFGGREMVIVVIHPRDACSSATDCPYRNESCTP